VAVRRAQVGQLRGVMSQRGGGRKAGWPMGWRVARRQAGDKFARLNFLSLSAGELGRVAATRASEEASSPLEADAAASAHLGSAPLIAAGRTARVAQSSSTSRARLALLAGRFRFQSSGGAR